jgi:zinc protease
VSGLLTQREQARASDGTIAGMLNSDNYLGRPMLRRAEFDARLKSLTVEQVNAAIRKFLKPDQLSVFVAGDFASHAAVRSEANAAKIPVATPAK